MPRIPDRWLSYSPIGKIIPGTRFISFKVPLKHALCDQLEDNDRFTPEMLMEQSPKLGLVVDLTNTNRYYDGQIFRSKGIQYKKIHCPGQVIPPGSILREFFKTVDAFLNEPDEHDSLVGVHCTHGLNRTGYFICRYLNLRMGFEPRDAISAFEKARGHKIEREPYIEDILSGKNIEEQKIVQRDQRWNGGRGPSGPYCDPGQNSRRCPVPGNPQITRANHIFESPLSNSYSDYIPSSYSRGYGPSKSGRAYQGRSHHRDSPYQWHPGSEKYQNSVSQSSSKHRDRSEDRFGAPRDRGQLRNDSTHWNSSVASIREHRPPTVTCKNDRKNFGMRKQKKFV